MHYTFLQHINNPADLKQLSEKDLEVLAAEIRHFIINIVSVKAGHLGANLGVVELTIAIHRIFDCAVNPLIWDVGHQAYTHKILTGRRDQFQSAKNLYTIILV